MHWLVHHQACRSIGPQRYERSSWWSHGEHRQPKIWIVLHWRQLQARYRYRYVCSQNWCCPESHRELTKRWGTPWLYLYYRNWDHPQQGVQDQSAKNDSFDLLTQAVEYRIKLRLLQDRQVPVPPWFTGQHGISLWKADRLRRLLDKLPNRLRLGG